MNSCSIDNSKLFLFVHNKVKNQKVIKKLTKSKTVHFDNNTCKNNGKTYSNLYLKTIKTKILINKYRYLT